MQPKREYRDREETQVAVLEALVGRSQEGMTVLELRSRVDVDIDRLEEALGELKADGLIEVSEGSTRTVITPAEHVIEHGGDDRARTLVDRILERLPF